ncbi:MAG: hypothetical protein N2317_01025 [Syntrophales bacterium]|nr:hypothetical protein [Syntrophales bacterium]
MARAVVHTFLFEEWQWVASGIYVDANTRIYPVEGRIRVTHDPDLWIVESTIWIVADDSIRFSNRYEVQPVRGDGDITTWEAKNPHLGTMSGNFIIVDDSILSLYETEGGAMRGVEYWRLIDEDLYWCRGGLTKGGSKISSWAIELRRL